MDECDWLEHRMSQSEPKPSGRPRGPKICPVCGKASYSAAGVHPQCSLKQADQERAKEIKAKQAKAEEESKKSPKANQTARWQKQCPKCKASQHVRKKKCDCGHSFAVG